MLWFVAVDGAVILGRAKLTHKHIQINGDERFLILMLDLWVLGSFRNVINARITECWQKSCDFVTLEWMESSECHDLWPQPWISFCYLTAQNQPQPLKDSRNETERNIVHQHWNGNITSLPVVSFMWSRIIIPVNVTLCHFDSHCYCQMSRCAVRRLFSPHFSFHPPYGRLILILHLCFCFIGFIHLRGETQSLVSAYCTLR